MSRNKKGTHIYVYLYFPNTIHCAFLGSTSQASCAAHVNCRKLAIDGDCCPTPEGDNLDCW